MKVYIYGAGNEYRRFRDFSSPFKDSLEVLGIVTTEDIGVEYLDGYKVIRPSEICQDEMDFVVIAVWKWTDIVEILSQYNIKILKKLRKNY